jgi:hypothetical protein
MAAKFFTGLPLDGPDPECVLGHGERALTKRGDALRPQPSVDRSRRTMRMLPVIQPEAAVRPCEEGPLAGVVPAGPTG